MSVGERRKNLEQGVLFLAYMYVFGWFLMVAGLFFLEIPTSNKELILTLGGLMGSVQAAIIGYYFGASRQGTQRAPSSVTTPSMDVKAEDVKVEKTS